jgi:transcription termination factor Rho
MTPDSTPNAFPPAPQEDRPEAPKKRVTVKKTTVAKKATKAKSAPVAPPIEAPVKAVPAKKAAAKKTAKKAAKKAATRSIAAPKKVEPTPPAPVPAPAAEVVIAKPTLVQPEPAPAAVSEPSVRETAPIAVTEVLAAPVAAAESKPQAEAAVSVEAPTQIADAAPAGEPKSPTTRPDHQPKHEQGGQEQRQHPHQREHQQGNGQRGNRHENRRDRERDRNQKQGDKFQARPPREQREPQPERPLGPPEPTDGILELTPKGYGFLRQKDKQFAQLPNDPFVSPEWIRKLGLREGMFIKGQARMGHRGPQVTEITEVMGREADTIRDLPLFEELKAINPNKRIQLETRSDRLTTRVMDLMTPVGRGQRGLIVAPPRAGKTTLLQHIAEAVVTNHPQMHLIILLVDERPEEVTEFRRALPNAEIMASSNDSDVKSHMRIAAFAIERAKRLVEAGQHVFVLLDSITRMARAFNNAQKGGATMSGGMGVGAMENPRRLFAAARNTREAGSLTILATALVETGSRMDDLIFQEFKGTGNLELVLDRKIAEQYIYPAVNIFKSGTRREELLLPAFQMEKIHLLRRGLAGHKPVDAIQRVITLMERSTSNAQMLIQLPGKTNV